METTRYTPDLPDTVSSMVVQAQQKQREGEAYFRIYVGEKAGALSTVCGRDNGFVFNLAAPDLQVCEYVEEFVEQTALGSGITKFWLEIVSAKKVIARATVIAKAMEHEIAGPASGFEATQEMLRTANKNSEFLFGKVMDMVDRHHKLIETLGEHLKFAGFIEGYNDGGGFDKNNQQQQTPMENMAMRLIEKKIEQKMLTRGSGSFATLATKVASGQDMTDSELADWKNGLAIIEQAKQSKESK